MFSWFHQIFPECPPAGCSASLVVWSIHLLISAVILGEELVPIGHPGKGRHHLWTQDYRKKQVRILKLDATKILWDIFMSTKIMLIKTIQLLRRSSMILYKLKEIMDIFRNGSLRSKSLTQEKVVEKTWWLQLDEANFMSLSDSRSLNLRFLLLEKQSSKVNSQILKF